MHTALLRSLRLCCLLLMCALPLAPAEARDSALNRLAASLVDGPAPLRADLAQTALAELSAAYAQEAQRAREDQRRNPRNRDLQRWAAAIDGLAAEHAALAAAVTAFTPVDVSIGPDHDLHLIVAGKPVVVAGPRPREQAALEQRILERYCTLNLCDPEAFAPPPPQRVPPSGASLAARGTEPARSMPVPDGAVTRWSFSPAGPSCITDDGLEFQFANADELRQKRRLCALIVSELQALARTLAQQTAVGIGIEWNALRIQPTADPGRQTVLLNAGGSAIELRLPNLNALPELFELVRPWLAARVRGEAYHLVVINAERYLAALLLTPES